MAASLWLVLDDGYPLLAGLLSLPVLILLWLLRNDRSAGCELRYSRGHWRLRAEGEWRDIAPGARSVLSGLLIALVYIDTPMAKQRTLWVFVDSLQREDWRRLRAVLTLGRRE